ncbi:MAG: extracellular solute-binding protein [Bacilli bacterium]|nr:extracellular solute-binding protein [Bacilli bacterium]MDY6431208.1 extracellular solute-binding protein [Bacilli bacterium]
MINKKSLLVLALTAMGLAACGGGGATSQGTSAGTSATSEATSQATSEATSEEPVVTSEEESESEPVVSESEEESESHHTGLLTSDIPAGAVSLSMWCPTDDTEVYTSRIEEFHNANPDIFINITGNYGEGDVGAELAKDITQAADIFAIADDNIPTAAKNGYLTALTDAEKEAVRETDGDMGVKAGQYADNLYGFPFRADNGYILYYNPEFITASDARSMDSIMAKAKAQGKQVYWDMGNGWYGPSPFLANGVTFGLDNDGKMVTTFASEESAYAADALMDMYYEYGGDTWIISSDAGDIDAGWAAEEVVACVLWNHYADLVATVGEDAVAISKLPTMRINNAAKQLWTFNGYKYLSIKAGIGDAKVVAAKKFLKWMTTEENQLKLAEEKGYGPSNLAAAADEDVLAMPFIGQIADMVSRGCTIAQGPSVNDNFWTPMGSVGTAIKAGKESGKSWGTGYGVGHEGALAFMADVADEMEK